MSAATPSPTPCVRRPRPDLPEDLIWFLCEAESALGERSSLSAQIRTLESGGAHGAPSDLPQCIAHLRLRVGELPGTKWARLRMAWSKVPPQHRRFLRVAALGCLPESYIPGVSTLAIELAQHCSETELARLERGAGVAQWERRARKELAHALDSWADAVRVGLPSPKAKAKAPPIPDFTSSGGGWGWL